MQNMLRVKEERERKKEIININFFTYLNYVFTFAFSQKC